MWRCCDFSRFRDKNRDFSDSPQLFRLSAAFPILRNFSDFSRFTATFNVFPENVNALLSKFSDLSLKYAVEQKIKNEKCRDVAIFRDFATKIAIFQILRKFYDSPQLFRFSATFSATFRNFSQNLPQLLGVLSYNIAYYFALTTDNLGL